MPYSIRIEINERKQIPELFVYIRNGIIFWRRKQRSRE